MESDNNTSKNSSYQVNGERNTAGDYPKVYPGDRTTSYIAARGQSCDKEYFIPTFIGVLSCYVPDQVWNHALVATEKMIAERKSIKDGAA